MNETPFRARAPLPLTTIRAARTGESEAVEAVLRFYGGYIHALCTRTVYDAEDQPRACVDEYMKRRLEVKLIHTLVGAAPRT